MAVSPSKLSVAVWLPRAVIKLCGRASFTCSPDFKSLVYGLHQKGCREFHVELCECSIMDSTFVGILVWFAQFLSQPGANAGQVTLHRPCTRIVDLLDNLGMSSYFILDPGEAPVLAPSSLDEEIQCGEPKDKAEATRTALQAHETLVALNPANAPKFKDVTAFMAEDLKRIEREQATRSKE